MRRAVTVGLALLVLFGGGACTRGSPQPRSTGDIKTDSDRLEAAVTVRVRGDDTLDFDGRTTILIFRTLDDRVPLGFRLFSVGIPDPGLRLEPSVFARAAFDVLGFKGDGRYTIGRTIFGSPTAGEGVQVPSGIQSNAFVQWFRPAGEPPVTRYDVALEPCRVQAADEARRGSLSCPKLQRDVGTQTVSLDMTWDATT